MSPSDYRCEFTLKQHTPIIHFQHDQPGATLRPTELKPKLDRFLIERFKKDKIDYMPFLIAGQDGALDYKVRVEPNAKVEKYVIFSFLSKKRVNGWNIKNIQIIPHSLYFAQEEEYKNLFDEQNHPKTEEISKLTKMGLMSPKPFKITFTAFNQELKQAIQANIVHFFAKENFGTRQNKGFGSFFIEEENLDYEGLLTENFQYIYKLQQNNKNVKNIFKIIKDEYMKLKSGINLYIELPNKTIDTYEKSKLFTFFAKDKNVRWEKRRIKQLINNNLHDSKALKISGRTNTEPIKDANGTQSWSDDNSNFRYQYTRALLGLTDKFEFMIEDSKDKYIVKVSNDTLKRYKSPITVKVYEGNIYFCADDVDYSFFEDELFEFKFYYKNSNGETELQVNHTEGINGRDSRSNTLRLPVPTNFNLGEFLEYALSQNWTDIKGATNATN